MSLKGQDSYRIHPALLTTLLRSKSGIRITKLHKFCGRSSGRVVRGIPGCINNTEYAASSVSCTRVNRSVNAGSHVSNAACMVSRRAALLYRSKSIAASLPRTYEIHKRMERRKQQQQEESES